MRRKASWVRRLGQGSALRLLVLTAACSPPDDARPAYPDTGSADPISWDLVIHGATVVDGTGGPAWQADVLVRDGLIAYVGPVDPDTLQVAERVEGHGLVLAPGFIDPHAHGDPSSGEAFDSFLAQGVTTIILGQDGSSPSPAEFGRHLDAVDAAAPAINVGYLVGHNTVRRDSGIGFRRPDAEGLEAMRTLVREALDAGALGLSTGLEYTPGNQATADELAALAEPVAAMNGVVMSHVRSEDAAMIRASVEELLEQGRRSGARVHLSHAKIVLEDDPDAAERVLAVMDSARSQGVRVTADVYPYTASFTGLSILFPDWARGPTPYAEVVRTRRSELAAHLRRRVNERNGPEATLFGTGPYSGLTLAEAAEREGRSFEDILMELGPGGASAAYFVMDEAVMARFLTDTHVAVSSDGSPTMSHPRGYGSFARVLRRYVMEDSLLSLEEAVRKMTSLPSSILGLDRSTASTPPRGAIRSGWAADLVLFDPAEMRDRASFESPHTPAVGVRYLWVGGVLSWTPETGSSVPGSGRTLRRR